MPVSLLQHRKLAGIHQNKLQDNLRRYSTTQAQSKGPDHSAIPDGKIHFGSSIHTVVNSNDELNRVSHQTTNPRQCIAAPLLMLLSQVRLADGINLISTLRDSIPQTPSRGGLYFKMILYVFLGKMHYLSEIKIQIDSQDMPYLKRKQRLILPYLMMLKLKNGIFPALKIDSI